MITQGQTTAFKLACLNALFGGGNTYKIALYTGNASLDNTTTVYTSANEVTGGGYTAGGKLLTTIAPSSDNQANTAFVSFSNVTWNPASFTCRGALIYNATTLAAVAVLDFGSDKTANTTFTITFPTDNAANAVIRIA